MPPDDPLKVDPWKVDDWRELVRPQGYPARESAGRAIARRIAPPLFLIVGLVLIAVAVLESAAVWRLERAGVRAPGVVSSLDASHCSSSNLSMCFHAVVTYDTRSGQRVSFRDGYGSNPSPYRAGQGVTVLYRPDRPGSAIIDRGILNWIVPGALWVMGAGFALFAWAGFSAWAKIQRTSGGPA